LNESNYLVQALDYDSWGYLARSWDTTATRYKFTGKERDNETGYDYFGARYFNSRTAVWLSTDPLFEKHIQFTPYNYVLGNPMIMIDPDGRQIRLPDNEKSRENQLNMIRMLFDRKYSDYFSCRQSNNGEYFLDEQKLKEADITNNDIYEMILYLASNNEHITSISFLKGEDYFWYNKKGVLSETNLATGFFNGPLYGYSFLSGKIISIEDPISTSQNGENVIMINLDYGNEEAVVTLAHEFVHVFNYIKGKNWSDFNPFVVNKIINIEKMARESYKKWENEK